MSEEMVPLRKINKKGLGRGLGSLLGEIEPTKQAPSQPVVTKDGPPALPNNGERIVKVAIEKIVANKEQPRKSFNPQKLQELAQSIKEKGIILPIVVRPLEGGSFQIIAGERRWRAAQLAGVHEVPVIFKATSPGEALELALIENIQRDDLNPMDEAEAYGVLLNKYGLTQAQISEKVSKERSTIANLLRLLTLVPEAKELIKAGELSLGQAKVLLGVTEASTQKILAKKAAKQSLSVRAIERLVAKYKKNEGMELATEDVTLGARQLQPLVAELQKMFGTKVEIVPIGSGGKVSFYFYSQPELNQFVDKLRKSTP